MRIWKNLLLIVLVATPAWAEVKLPAIISDHMVLQAGQPIVLWGWCDAGETVTVALNGDVASITGGDRWKLTLPAQQVGGPYQLTVTGASNTITVNDVFIGEVWIGSGQSNMQWSVNKSNNPDEEIAAANYPQIRLFSVPRVSRTTPQDDVEGKWELCTPETVPEFSAVLYYFGRHLHTELGRPMGLIHTSWGGTPAESWASRESLTADADLKRIVDTWDKQLEEFPAAQSAFEAAMLVWEADAAKAKADGTDAPQKPVAPRGPDHPWVASGLYNAMIHPLVPYGIKGAVWYQGESNAGRAYQYRKLFKTMIQDWRNAWGQEHLSFYFVQLANFKDTKPEPGESEWAELREAQNMALELPDTGSAVIIDIGEAKDIHPRNKQDVGKRLALNALAKDYNKRVEYSGPVYKSMRIKDNIVKLSFDHAKGLTARGGQLTGFALAGEDKKFVWATANIKNGKVVLNALGVDHPVAVRYAWADNPTCNLYNAAGLPASPFRTDDWPGITLGVE